jgi:hypothetical protein
MFAYFYIYILVVLLLIVAGKLKSDTILLLTVFIMFLFSGFAYEVGTDWHYYKTVYFSEFSNLEILSVMDPVFLLIRNIGKFLSLDWVFLQVVYVLLILFFTYLGLQRFSTYKGYAWFVYMSLPNMFLMSMVGFRQSLAVSISFFAISIFATHGKIRKVYLYLIFSAAAHYSAVAILALVFLLKKYLYIVYARKTYAILVILSLIAWKIGLGQYLQSLLFGRYESYDLSYDIGVNTMRLIANNGLFLLILFQKDLFLSDKKIIVLFNVFVCGLLILNVMADNVYLSRMYIYFEVMLLVLLPRLIFIQRDKSLKYFYFISVSFYLISYYINSVIMYTTPYNNYIYSS